MLSRNRDLLYMCLGAVIGLALSGLAIHFYVGVHLALGGKIFLRTLSTLGMAAFIATNRPK